MRIPFSLACALVLAEASLAQNLTTCPQRSTRASIPAHPAPIAAAVGLPRQELYVNDFDGNLYRVENYATSPTPVLVANTGLFRTADIAFYPGRRMVSCSFASFPVTRFHTHDAVLQPALIGTDTSMLWANALDIGADGTAWARSANTFGLWTLDLGTGAPTFVTDMFAPTAGDVAVDPTGRLIALDALGRVDMYDPATGAKAVLGFHGLGPDAWGFEIDLDGTAYVCTSNGDLHTLDLTTMTTTFLGNLGTRVGGCAFRLPADSGAVAGP